MLAAGAYLVDEEYDENVATDEFHSAEQSLEEIAEVELDWQYPTGTCIVCQEEMDSSSVYGMLGYVQTSVLLERMGENSLSGWSRIEILFRVIERRLRSIREKRICSCHQLTAPKGD